MMIKTLTGPLAATLTALLLAVFGHPYAICATAAVTVLCICWWAMEPIPVPVTSLIPLASLPLLGILDGKAIAAAYGSPLIILLMGGFLLSKAMESSEAHKKLALVALQRLGYDRPRKLVLSVMIITAAMSMWISNSATTLMMLPILQVILEKIDNPKLYAPLLLGLAYSASIGGMGTPIGTPPNLVMMSVYEEYQGQPLSFIRWMQWSIPVVCVLLPLVWLWLTRNLKNTTQTVDLSKFNVPWTPAMKRVLLIFSLTALAWVTRTAPFGGWGQFLPNANDGSVALTGVIALFIVGDGRGGKLMTWDHAVTIPWGVLLLFAGGIAIAKAFQASGLSDLLGQSIAAAGGLPVLVMLLAVALGVCLMTEMVSNTASAVLLMPMLAVAAQYNQQPVELLMFPAALAASCAFMLPVATGPNAVVYGAEVGGKRTITVERMMREGLAVNVVAAIIIALAAYFQLAY